MKHLRHYRQNPVQWARFENHQRGFHCNQGWHSVHVKPRMNAHQWMLQKPTQGLRKLAEWLNTVCVLCRLGSDSGSVCSACREAMRADWDAVPRCWRCQQRLAATSAVSLERARMVTRTMTAKGIAAASTRLVPHLPGRQGLPFSLCRDCRRLPRSWQRAVAVVDYEQPWMYWIQGLKMQLRWQWAKPMGQLLGQAWNKLQAPRPVGPTLWVPIPASSGALQARGFNQACELARFAVPEVKQARLVHALRWQKAAPEAQQAQKWRTRRQRRYDRQRAFLASPRVRGAQVVLVDDVMTTGFTLQAAAHACSQAGAHSVWVAVFARVPHNQGS